MYHVAVEACLTGPGAGMEAAWKMIADYAVNVPEPLRRNEAHICLVNALKKIIMNGSKGVTGTTTIPSGNAKGATVRAQRYAEQGNAASSRAPRSKHPRIYRLHVGRVDYAGVRGRGLHGQSRRHAHDPPVY